MRRSRAERGGGCRARAAAREPLLFFPAAFLGRFSWCARRAGPPARRYGAGAWGKVAW
ncbi:hypothetical protein [Alicyclobacillus cellulosilyticus]|uniref:hypothetical protein n=1 Tax=Alicyclobacillus cellulosilyticus TaxID=1003997 RepID=UPI0016676095|nr:hypothetical protein [Alicyclobacillus cellulosilyticus]